MERYWITQDAFPGLWMHQ